MSNEVSFGWLRNTDKSLTGRNSNANVIIEKLCSDYGFERIEKQRLQICKTNDDKLYYYILDAGAVYPAGLDILLTAQCDSYVIVCPKKEGPLYFYKIESREKFIDNNKQQNRDFWYIQRLFPGEAIERKIDEFFNTYNGDIRKSNVR